MNTQKYGALQTYGQLHNQMDFYSPLDFDSDDNFYYSDYGYAPRCAWGNDCRRGCANFNKCAFMVIDEITNFDAVHRKNTYEEVRQYALEKRNKEIKEKNIQFGDSK